LVVAITMQGETTFLLVIIKGRELDFKNKL
jgi:hypothetical protein